MKTVAGNPGALKVDRWRLAWSEPVRPTIMIVAGVGLIVLSLFDRLVPWHIIGGFCLGLAPLGGGNKARQFREGDVNISKVLSLDPPLFATSTNMQNTLGAGEYPVIKIVRRKVPSVRGKRWKVGDYFPAACFYSGSFKKPHWNDFFPLPVTMATGRIEAVEGQMDRINHLIPELDLRLAMVPKPYKPGLYFLDAGKLVSLRADRNRERH